MRLIDPFLMQLFIVPLIVIGLGVIASALVRKVFIAPLITLFLNGLYEIWYMKYHYPDLEISFTSWNFIFPLISLAVASIVVPFLKQKNKQN